MNAPPTRPDVVAFDVNETLLDLAPVRAALIEHGQPADLLPTVFTRSLLTELSADDRSTIADAFMEMTPHPDVEPALRRLAEAGVRAVTLSHGSPGVAEAGLARGGVAALVERTLPAESIRAWKPNRAAYLWAAGVCDVAADRMALVAAHSWDVLGAQRAGLTGGFTSARSERVYADVFAAPHVQGSSLVEVVEALLALPPAA